MPLDRRLVQRFATSFLVLTVLLIAAMALLLPDSSKIPRGTSTSSLEDSFSYTGSRRRTSIREALRVYTEAYGPKAEDPLQLALKDQDKGQQKAPGPQKKTLAQVPPPKPVDDQIADGLDPQLQRAIDLIDSGQVQDAVALLEEIVKNDPQNEQALVELAMAHLLDLKQPGKAIEYLQQVMDFNPENRIVLSELVSLYEEEGRGEEGLAFLQSVKQRHPESQDVNYGIGQLLSAQGRDSEAIPYLEQAAKNSTDNPARVLGELAEAYSRGGQSDKAIDTYNNAISRLEQDVQDKASRGLPTQFAEDRIFMMKRDLVREYIDSGRFDSAQSLIDEIKSSASAEPETISGLQDQLNRRRG